MGQFSVGDVVTCIPHLIPRTAAPGDYKVTAAMPDAAGFARFPRGRTETVIVCTGSKALSKNTRE